MAMKSLLHEIQFLKGRNYLKNGNKVILAMNSNDFSFPPFESQLSTIIALNSQQSLKFLSSNNTAKATTFDRMEWRTWKNSRFGIFQTTPDTQLD